MEFGGIQNMRLADEALRELHVSATDDGDAFAVSGPHGDVDLTALEAEIAVQDGQLVSKLSERGVLLTDADGQSDLEHVRCQLTPDELTVLVDATTILSAMGALHDDNKILLPSALLDLSVLAFASVCFDEIVLQPHPAIRPWFSYLPPWVRVIEYDEDFISRRLYAMYLDVATCLQRTRERITYETAWGTFLGVPHRDVKIDPGKVDVHLQSPPHWDGVMADVYITDTLEQMMTADAAPSKFDDCLTDFLTVQTMRALFNDSLAGAIRVPYLASSIRGPVTGELLGRKAEILSAIDHILTSAAGRRTIQGETRLAARCGAPFLLGMALGKIDKPNQFFEALADLHDESQDFRERIRRDRDERDQPWEKRPGDYVRGFEKHLWALFPEAPVTQTALGAITEGASVATAADLSGLTLAAKLVKVLSPGKVLYRAFIRAFRPDVHFLFDLRNEAENLWLLARQIEGLWGRRWDRESFALLQRWSKAQPLSSLGLLDLGP